MESGRGRTAVQAGALGEIRHLLRVRADRAAGIPPGAGRWETGHAARGKPADAYENGRTG